MKLAFIINPISGAGKGKEIAEIIRNKKFDNQFSIEVLFTKYPGHALELVKELIKSKPNAIVAIGGDGTVNEVANALVNTNIPMGIIPIGSGNGLARHLKIPLAPQKALQNIINYNFRFIDAGKLNDRYFFCTCGVGFDARIGMKFANNEKRGFNTYFKLVVQEFKNYKPKKYKIKIDGKKSKKRAFLITFANAAQYGNNAYIAPKASTTDGLIDVSILKPFPVWKAVSLALMLFNKNIDRSKYLISKKGKNIIVKRKKAGEVHIDGDPYTMGKKLIIDIEPKALCVIVP